MPSATNFTNDYRRRETIFLGESGEPCRTTPYSQYQELKEANRQKVAVDGAWLFSRLANLTNPDPASENPGALAGATGVETEALENLPADHIAALAARHPIIAKHWGFAA